MTDIEIVVTQGNKTLFLVQAFVTIFLILF